MSKRTLILFLVLALSSVVLTAQQPLPIERIFLYKNGMAYVIRGGELTAPVRLSFHPDEMNDALKSLTAWNPTSGDLYSLGYTTGIPTEQLLSRYPFNLKGRKSGLAQFLQQIKGAVVSLESEGRRVQGKLLAVQPFTKTTADKSSVEDHYLSVIEDSGTVRTLVLSAVASLKMSDEQLERQLQSYLRILAEGSQDVTKEVSIYPVPGPGPIRVSYLQQFPVWKTSYRLHLDEERNQLQGWALIDNPTGEEWRDVELTLISGMPVSFVMNLYQPLYTTRVEVAVPGTAVAAPRIYESAVRKPRSDERAARRQERMTDRIAPPAPPAAAASEFSIAGDSLSELGYVQFEQATASQVQDYFEYKFPFPIRLDARQSAFLPFMSRKIQAQRLSIYNAATDPKHPFNGARLKNDTGVPLESGPITIFEQGRYAGEALLEYVPKDDERLISYGLDYEVEVVTERKSRPETTVLVKIRKGVATVTKERVQTITYELRNKAQRQKTVIVEHPRQAGRKLKDIKPYESTRSYHRFQVDLDAGAEAKLPVREVISRRSTLRIDDAEQEKLVLFFAGWKIPAALQKDLDSIAETRLRLSEARSEVNTLRKEISGIADDQKRLRENLKALGKSKPGQPLRNRYLRQLGNQEDRLDALKAGLKEATGRTRQLGVRLTEQISNLTWDG